MPDIVFARREDLPEELRSIAKDVEGGGVVINLVPNDKLKEFREKNIDLSRERDTLKAFQSDVIKIFPDFDVEKVGLEISDLRTTRKRVADGELTESKAIEEALEERVAKMKRDHEADVASRVRGMQDLQTTNAALVQRVKRQAVKQAVQNACMDEKSGVQGTAIDDIVNRAFGVFEVDEAGEVLTPKSGGTIMYGADGTTALTPAEWVSSLKDKLPHLFKQSNGGGFGGGEAKRFGGFTKEELEKMTPEQKIAAANAANRPKGL